MFAWVGSIAETSEHPAQTAAILYQEMTSFRVERTFDVSNLHILRDAATFELKSGTIELVEPADGRHHALLFEGDGVFRFTPPDSIEEHQIQKFTGDKILEESIKWIVFRFTDSLAHEVLSAANTTKLGAKRSSKKITESRKEILKNYNKNVDSRILRDIVSDQDGYFLAFISGRSNGTFLLEVDPEREEAVSVRQYTKAVRREFVDTWTSFPLGAGTDNRLRQRDGNQIEVPHFDVSIDIEKNGKFTSTAILDIVSLNPELHTVPLNISPLVEVEDVADDHGPCFFIYETARDRLGEPALKQDRLDIFFAEPLRKGENRKLKIAYRSDDLIRQINRRKEYLIIDTGGWYPSYGYLNRSTSSVTYCHPSGVDLIAVGEQVKEWKEEDKNCSTWEQTLPVAMISFMMGDFKHKQLTHEDLPPVDIFAGKIHSGIRFGSDPLDNVAADLMNSLNFFHTMFAHYPFSSIIATEIPGRHGQGFPGFLHLSRGTFDDRELTGIDEAFRAHEVSHQWWGHLVGWESYRDQWISEGFAEYSGALFADATLQDRKKDLLMRMLDNWRNDILYKGNLSFQRYGLPKLNSQLTMGSSSGPIWLGRRLHSSKSPMDYQILVYEKGAFVLHMLRMMMKDFESDSDDAFFAMMQDFARTHSWKKATTEDFRKTAEKHTGQDLEWFFNQWVYGTEVPAYEFEWRVEQGQEQTLVVDVSQSGVTDHFQMPVAIRVDFGNDQYAVVRLLIDQPSKTFRLKVPQEPHDVHFNYLHSVLSYK